MGACTDVGAELENVGKGPERTGSGIILDGDGDTFFVYREHKKEQTQDSAGLQYLSGNSHRGGFPESLDTFSERSYFLFEKVSASPSILVCWGCHTKYQTRFKQQKFTSHSSGG